MTEMEPASRKRKLSSFEEEAENDKKVNETEDERCRKCPYLDTIDRSILDFDFEKLCSISLSHINVYACLVCGKYFQGRGLKSHAYTHSIQEDHRVFLNLDTKKFYCLPDNYQVLDQSLEDIVYVLNPTFSTEHISLMDANVKLSRAYDSSTYLPGIVGLNNIKENDYCNVVLQALSHVSPLRNYFMQEQNYANIPREPGDMSRLLVQRFGELLRKLWNPRNFKAHVSPHEMLQSVVLCSRKKFQITKQGDSLDYLSWFLNSLDRSLKGSQSRSIIEEMKNKKNNKKDRNRKTIIGETFKGKMRVFTKKLPPIEMKEEEKKKLMNMPEYQEVMEETPFLFLTCDLPPAPLYPDVLRENIIPQVPLMTLLSKFNGEYKTMTDSVLKKFQIVKLPKYLILYFKRFIRNTFIMEKNPTIVNFPVRGVDLGEMLTEEVRGKHPYTTYDLLANIFHEGEIGKGSYKVNILHKGSGRWYEMQDLHSTDILPQMITLTESYVQIYELRKDDKEGKEEKV